MQPKRRVIWQLLPYHKITIWYPILHTLIAPNYIRVIVRLNVSCDLQTGYIKFLEIHLSICIVKGLFSGYFLIKSNRLIQVLIFHEICNIFFHFFRPINYRRFCFALFFDGQSNIVANRICWKEVLSHADVSPKKQEDLRVLTQTQ